MRYLVVLIVLHWASLAAAQDWEDRQLFGQPEAERTLRIISSTDISFFAPVIDSFLADRPGVAVDYMVTGTADLDRIFRADPDGFDMVISSAMDLQIKLTNDGFAQRVEGIPLPPWAEWRQSLFAFTSEPAAIVINKDAFAGHPIPATRQELIQALRARPEVFQNRVGTYDVRQSGLGYLFATQDARATDTFWRLMEVLGNLNARLYCCSGDMIDDLADGTLAVAYNVLGSYAAARTDARDKLEIILPSDYPTTMMRTVLVSRTTQDADLAAGFVDHLVGAQSDAAERTLPPLMTAASDGGQVSIALEPALMTYLDALKRRTFLAEWQNAVIQ
ncbi:MAG: extracellular solute-binding protein [Pseudomonadota bacterium]